MNRIVFQRVNNEPSFLKSAKVFLYNSIPNDLNPAWKLTNVNIVNGQFAYNVDDDGEYKSKKIN